MAKNLRENIEHFNNNLKPYYVLFGMIVFFVGLFLACYKILVKSPELIVYLTKENINYPNSINEKYTKVYNQFIRLNTDSVINIDAYRVFKYLINTKQNLIVRLENETDKTLEKVNLRITNVNDITSWAVSSDYLLEEENNKVLGKVKFQEGSNIVYLSDFVSIPPKRSMSLYLWGKFDESLWNDNVLVTYDGGTGIVEKKIEVTGFKAYLVDYYFEIFSFLLLIFCIVYLYIVKGKTIETVDIKKNTGFIS